MNWPHRKRAGDRTLILRAEYHFLFATKLLASITSRLLIGEPTLAWLRSPSFVLPKLHPNLLHFDAARTASTPILLCQTPVRRMRLHSHAHAHERARANAHEHAHAHVQTTWQSIGCSTATISWNDVFTLTPRRPCWQRKRREGVVLGKKNMLPGIE